MAAEYRKPSRNEVAEAVRDELESRRLFNEHYEVYVSEVALRAGVTVAGEGGGSQAGSTVVSLRVVVSWGKGVLAVDQVNNLQDHLDAHWLGRRGKAKLDHEECKVTIDGEYHWASWRREW